MSRVTVVARLLARKEAADAVKAELLKLLAPTRNEEGCVEYRLHQDNDDPALFFFYETWESDACLGKHKETTHYRNSFGAIEGMIRERSVNRLTMIEA
ncbi:antibiotic biosynthesis monooxygenase [Oryzomonas sagensis]|uniref:Antibiotic biosynthesis monooxygenase n=1 Tax=Oryzomonas sagensis TaxID=2603857 RepID=A0ABQ6TTK1_9BACT|nr:putative quinol monooxygenase [Oryzomonas sagensis]KAB0672144.1 antibiotic biosynthesis monooxygenase [Oryzomonas sagensis]